MMSIIHSRQSVTLLTRKKSSSSTQMTICCRRAMDTTSWVLYSSFQTRTIILSLSSNLYTTKLSNTWFLNTIIEQNGNSQLYTWDFSKRYATSATGKLSMMISLFCYRRKKSWPRWKKSICSTKVKKEKKIFTSWPKRATM